MHVLMLTIKQIASKGLISLKPAPSRIPLIGAAQLVNCRSVHEAIKKDIKKGSKMPKEPLAAREMKKQRLAKIASDRYRGLTPGRVTMHVLGNGGPGNPNVLYMTTEHNTYVWNCGEGTQRLSHEHGLKLTKLEQVFLTRVCWDTIGGMPGMSMTLQAVGIPSMAVHSPRKMTPLYEMTKLFSITADMDIREQDTKRGSFSDATMNVQYVRLTKGSSSSATANTDGDSTKKLKLEEDDCSVLCYICCVHALPGALDIKKCIHLGIPRGPHLGVLKNGGEYKFPDGRVVTSQEVTIPGEPGPIFLVIDCPDDTFIDQLVNNEQLNAYQKQSLDNETVSYVIHFSPSSVVNDERYKNWAEAFPISTTHVVLNEDNPLTGFRSAQLQVKLNLIDKDIFPLLVAETRSFDASQAAKEQSIFLKAETKLQLNLRPLTEGKVNKHQVHRLEPKDFEDEAHAVENFDAAVEEYKTKVAQLKTTDKIYPEIIFLGTASSCPGKDRNVSAIWVNIDEKRSFLLDCGEGTYGQLVRLFGPNDVGAQLVKLKGIFISHLHADHQLGLIKLLLEREKLEKSPVHMILPSAVRTWLTEYDQVYERVAHTFVPYNNETVVANAPPNVLDDIGLLRLQTARVKHCRDSFGITFTTKADSFKISYSGDAADPSPHFENVAKKSHVLIHEATMEDELEEEARIKAHSTTSQAIEVAKRCEADYLILTHFSQRYAKIPMISNAFKDRKIGIAFDNMVIKRCHLERLPLMMNSLQTLFVDYIEENLQRQLKKKFKKDVLSQMGNRS